MKSNQYAECKHVYQNGHKCKNLPSEHGIEKGRGAIVSHPFVLEAGR